MSILLAVNVVGNESAPYGHFQIVGPDGNEIEVQPSGLGAGNWVVTIRDHDGTTPSPIPFMPNNPNTFGNVNGVVNGDIYNSVSLPSQEGQSDTQLWQLLTNIGLAIQSEQQNIAYRNQGVLDENGMGVLDENGWPIILENGTQNSNTFISTLLSVIGIDLANYVNGAQPSILQDLNFQTVPGYTHNVLLDPLSGEPISLTLSGTDGNDFIRTGNGEDFIYGGLGNDILDGGANTDTLTYENLTSGVHISLDQATTGDLDSNFTATGSGPTGDWVDHFTNFESLTLTAFDDTVSVSQTNLENQSINAGDDLEAGDTVNLSGLGADGGITFDLITRDLEVEGEGNHLSLQNFENVVGTNFTDTITGNSANNILYGGGGADSLSGGAGDDILIFDAEDTLVDGGAGRDVGIVTGEAGVTVDLAEAAATLGGAEVGYMIRKDHFSKHKQLAFQ